MGVMQRLAHQRSNLSIAALCGARQFIQWQHYPARDAVDATHHSEFYYHAHNGAQHSHDEHGHFHVFTRPGGRQRFHHLIGVSMNPKGLPTRLFLTNQWVTENTGQRRSNWSRCSMSFTASCAADYHQSADGFRPWCICIAQRSRPCISGDFTGISSGNGQPAVDRTSRIGVGMSSVRGRLI